MEKSSSEVGKLKSSSLEKIMDSYAIKKSDAFLGVQF